MACRQVLSLASNRHARHRFPTRCFPGIGHSRNDAPGQSASGDQSGPGLPRFRSAGRPDRGPRTKCARPLSPVFNHLGFDPFSSGAGSKNQPLHRPGNRTRQASRHHLRQYRGDDGRHDDRLYPGDKVIVFSPFYENYAADAILSGAEPIYVSLQPPDFAFDPDELRRAFAQKPKALVLCNPSNPCGKVFTREEMLFILDLAREHDAFVITDEVYEHIVYAPHVLISFATLPGAWERTLTCGSLSKTYSITGWRLGYVPAAAEIISQARKVHDFLTVGAAAPLQEAAVTALEFPDSYYAELLAQYTRKRDLFLGYLRKTGLPFTTPQGAYYTLVDISSLGFTNDRVAAEEWTKSIGVTGVPGSSFFREPVHRYIRFHFAKKDETLHQAGERLVTKLN